MRKQHGLSLIGLIVVSVILILVALLGFKLLPTYIEYFSVKRAVTDIAREPDMQGASVREIGAAFDRRASIDNISSIDSTDLEIIKQGNGISIIAAYSVRVPLFANISACIDFQAEGGR